MNTLEKHFKIRERGSSVRTEVLAGMTTFATMAYIIILQPVNMRDTGMDTVGILIATALVSACITMLMGGGGQHAYCSGSRDCVRHCAYLFYRSAGIG